VLVNSFGSVSVSDHNKVSEFRFDSIYTVSTQYFCLNRKTTILHKDFLRNVEERNFTKCLRNVAKFIAYHPYSAARVHRACFAYLSEPSCEASMKWWLLPPLISDSIQTLAGCGVLWPHLKK
jgi:hypothetical protein